MHCPLCYQRVILSLLYIVCARCHRAWLPYEYDSLWIRRRQGETIA